MNEEEDIKPQKDSEPSFESLGEKLQEFARPLYMRVILSIIVTSLFLWAFTSFFSSSPPILQKHYTIAMDPSWYPLQSQIKQRNMTAFCETLLKEIIDGTEIHVDITQVPPDRLFSDLNAAKYDGVISLLLPSPSLTAGYSYLFSSPIYRVGPVLVINASESIKPLEQMSGSLIALVGDARLSTDIENYPTVIFTGYDNLARAFADLNNRKIDGLITDSIRAKNFVSGFYTNKFHVADFLKDDEGIRLILHDNKTAEFFIDFFNKKLEELRANGSYVQLLEMWKIPPE
ncbi:MAG: transporter substrate-binding domain-containing protein [Parachlamydiaceae bacterium]|nr:transporter substrate-binding domain-containing protein [Parachlamydiaceae bacterium]